MVGSLTTDAGVIVEFAHLLGPLLFAHVAGDIEIDQSFGREIVDRFLAAFGPVA